MADKMEAEDTTDAGGGNNIRENVAETAEGETVMETVRSENMQVATENRNSGETADTATGNGGEMAAEDNENNDGETGETDMETDEDDTDDEDEIETVGQPKKKGGGGLIWTLQPHSYESLLSLERLYRQGVLKRAFESDVRNSGCFNGLDLDDLKVEVSFKEPELRACKEELSLGDSFMKDLKGSWSSPNAPSASREKCEECVRKLAEHHLLITSYYVSRYLRNHVPLFMKLGEIALTQYTSRERDLEGIARKLGFSLLDEDILNSGFVTIDPSAPNQSVFNSEELRAWFAAYLVVKKPAIERLDLLNYQTVDAFVGDGDLHQCLISLESAYIYRIASRMKFPTVEPTDVQKMVTWLQKLEGELGPLHDTAGSRGFYIGQMVALHFQCKKWTFSHLELQPQDLEAIVQGFHHKHGGACPMETIVLSHNQLEGGGASLAHFMMCLSFCKQWDISNTGLTPKDFADLAETIGDKKLEQLTNLVLDKAQEVSDEDQRMQVLVDLMPKCQISYKDGSG